MTTQDAAIKIQVKHLTKRFGDLTVLEDIYNVFQSLLMLLGVTNND